MPLLPPTLKRPSFGPLQQRLGVLAIIALVPLTLVALTSVVISGRDQRQAVLSTAGDTVSAVTTAVDGELALSLASLETLSLSPRLQSGDLRGFHEEAAELLKRRDNWANIGLTRADGQQAVNARIPYDKPLPRTPAPAEIDKVVKEGLPIIGGVLTAPLLKEMVFTLRIPVRVGKEFMVLGAAIKPDSLLDVLHRQLAPAPGVFFVVDAQNNIVARSRNHANYAGRPASEALRQLAQGRNSGWGHAPMLDDESDYVVFQRSSTSQWLIVFGLPKDVVDGPLIRSYLLLGGGIFASLLLGLAAAFFVSLKISRPMLELGDAALAMGAGRRPSVPDTPLPEIRRVGQALEDAHNEREKLLGLEREARHQAEEANRLKDEFLAMLGHELRNPLSAISNAIQILDHAGNTQEGMGLEAKAIIRRQAVHLSLLTDDLLDLGRIISGQANLDRQPVNLTEAVQRVVATFRATGRLERHRIEVDAAPAWVEADATRLEQIATNLITNAIKYTPEGGRITVRVREDGPQGVFEVSDSGVGMEPELVERVFDLFVQGRRSLDRSEGGLGIGLTLVKRLVELLGGRVEAHSEGPGKGSRFVVRLPASQPRAQAQAPAPDGAMRARRIVIVEDNEDARSSLRALLELRGHQIQEAADGIAGIDLILRERPDIALVDIGLPGVDGYALAREVRSKLGKSVFLVAVTGYGLPEDRAKSAQAGFDLHMVKPLDPDGLATVLAGVAQ